MELLERPMECKAIWEWLGRKVGDGSVEVEAIDRGGRRTQVRRKDGVWEVKGEDNGNWHLVDDRLWILGMCMPVFEEEERSASVERWNEVVGRLPL